MTIRVPLPGESELLTKALDGDMLDSQAGWLIFERGREYAAGQRVTGLEATATRATATAVGTRPYEVSIELEGAALNLDCSCPMGRAASQEDAPALRCRRPPGRVRGADR